MNKIDIEHTATKSGTVGDISKTLGDYETAFAKIMYRDRMHIVVITKFAMVSLTNGDTWNYRVETNTIPVIEQYHNGSKITINVGEHE